jgi:hypothetical protein
MIQKLCNKFDIVDMCVCYGVISGIGIGIGLVKVSGIGYRS